MFGMTKKKYGMTIFPRPLIDYVKFITIILEETNYLKLERIQRCAARNITYWPIKTSTQTICDQIQLVDIRTRA